MPEELKLRLVLNQECHSLHEATFFLNARKKAAPERQWTLGLIEGSAWRYGVYEVLPAARPPRESTPRFEFNDLCDCRQDALYLVSALIGVAPEKEWAIRPSTYRPGHYGVYQVIRE